MTCRGISGSIGGLLSIPNRRLRASVRREMPGPLLAGHYCLCTAVHQKHYNCSISKNYNRLYIIYRPRDIWLRLFIKARIFELDK